MTTISFSHIAAPDAPDLVTPAIQEFEQQTGIHVEIHRLTWEDAWSDLTRSSIYRYGFDVSEIGSTWLSDFVGMNSLRPFTQMEIDKLGGQNAFLEPLWSTTSLAGMPQTWAVPWLADTRFVYYRKDALKEAGIDEKKAFSTPEAFKQTLKRLQQRTHQGPLALPTHKTRMTLHNAAAWVWGANGHFGDPEGQSVRFAAPEAISGFTHYFELGQFVDPAHHEVDDVESDALFWNGQVPVTISGPWLRLQPTVMQQGGIAFPPGRPFIGGSNLVLWRHTLHPREALELVRFLTGAYAQEAYFRKGVLWPVRLDVLASSTLISDPIHEFISQGLQKGRSFRLMRLWGLIEERLATTLVQIWKEVLANPNTNVRDIVKENLEPLAQNINNMLANE